MVEKQSLDQQKNKSCLHRYNFHYDFMVCFFFKLHCVHAVKLLLEMPFNLPLASVLFSILSVWVDLCVVKTEF